MFLMYHGMLKPPIRSSEPNTGPTRKGKECCKPMPTMPSFRTATQMLIG
uniref:Uncharacterized protein n=1 Tax=Anguilla anguilla TaxID=7936 RepID=A0A0E9SW74_ANGAN